MIVTLLQSAAEGINCLLRRRSKQAERPREIEWIKEYHHQSKHQKHQYQEAGYQTTCASPASWLWLRLRWKLGITSCLAGEGWGSLGRRPIGWRLRGIAWRACRRLLAIALGRWPSIRLSLPASLLCIALPLEGR